MKSALFRWIFPALAGFVLLGCDAQEPGTLVKSHPVTPAPEAGTTPAPAQLTDVEWIDTLLGSLEQDPQKEFDLEALSTPSNREFSAWVGESLIAAGLGDVQGSPDISVSFKDLFEEAPNLKLWFSEEFTQEVLEVGDQAAQSQAALETDAGVLVPVVQSSTRLVSAQCRPEPAQLCAFVLTVDWLKNKLRGLLVLVSAPEESGWGLRLYSPADGSLKPVSSVEEYLAKIQAQQEESRRALAEKCQVDPLSDETGCLEALEMDTEGMEQLVIHLCTAGTAEGTTLDQCSARFVQYCSQPEESTFPEIQEQVCAKMADVGYSLEVSEETGQSMDQEESESEETSMEDQEGTDSDRGSDFDSEIDAEEF